MEDPITKLWNACTSRVATLPVSSEGHSDTAEESRPVIQPGILAGPDNSGYYGTDLGLAVLLSDTYRSRYLGLNTDRPAWLALRNGSRLKAVNQDSYGWFSQELAKALALSGIAAKEFVALYRPGVRCAVGKAYTSGRRKESVANDCFESRQLDGVERIRIPAVFLVVGMDGERARLVAYKVSMGLPGLKVHYSTPTGFRGYSTSKTYRGFDYMLIPGPGPSKESCGKYPAKYRVDFSGHPYTSKEGAISEPEAAAWLNALLMQGNASLEGEL